jgi:transposase
LCAAAGIEYRRRGLVLVSKYADQLPLYRQAQIYARQGIELDRSTLADWVGRVAFLLRPIHKRLLAALKGSAKLFADETTALAAGIEYRRTKLGQLWAYARDDRPWGAPTRPGIAYVYAPDCKAERPIIHLAAFKGIPQVDATVAIGCSPSAATYSLPSAGPMFAVAFTNSPRPARRRSPARRSSASQIYMPSRRTSVAAVPTNEAPCARTGAGRSSMSSSP